MPLAQRLISKKNWRYALGELLLIVSGVTIALVATSWYEDRTARQRELDLFQELRLALESDRQTLSANYDATSERTEHLKELVSKLESGSAYDDSMPELFRQLNGWRGVRIRKAPFEALKELGLDVISNSEIRSGLVTLYEDSYVSLETSANNDRSFVVNHSLPYFFDNFRRTSDSLWVPDDYDAIQQEGRVVDMARWRIVTISTFQLRAYQETLDDMDNLISLIDQELETTSVPN